MNVIGIIYIFKDNVIEINTKHFIITYDQLHAAQVTGDTIFAHLLMIGVLYNNKEY